MEACFGAAWRGRGVSLADEIGLPVDKVGKYIN